MPKSILTQTLKSAAHSLGDQYYYHQTIAARSPNGLDAAYADLARSYVEALEALRAHLLTLERSFDNDHAIELTENFLLLVRKDLADFENNSRMARHAA